MALKSFKELIGWQKALTLVTNIYNSTRIFPKDEIYGLRPELRRAAVSIRSNIAEGQWRTTTKDFLSFLAITRGSLAEVETQVLIAEELHYCEPEQARSLLDKISEVGRLLSDLQNSLTTTNH